jgi:hypothetical protein
MERVTKTASSSIPTGDFGKKPSAAHLCRGESGVYWPSHHAAVTVEGSIEVSYPSLNMMPGTREARTC